MDGREDVLYHLSRACIHDFCFCFRSGWGETKRRADITELAIELGKL